MTLAGFVDYDEIPWTFFRGIPKKHAIRSHESFTIEEDH
jgi:hypothetical protein